MVDGSLRICIHNRGEHYPLTPAPSDGYRIALLMERIYPSNFCSGEGFMIMTKRRLMPVGDL